MYEQFSYAIQQKYPDLQIEGDNFPPPLYKTWSAQGLGIIKLLLIAMIIGNQNPFAWFNLATPGIFSWAQQNKIYACMMLFFIGNAIEGQLISTGAFEIIFNDVPVWSKLETGRVPSPQEMFQIIDNNMRMRSGQ